MRGDVARLPAACCARRRAAARGGARRAARPPPQRGRARSRLRAARRTSAVEVGARHSAGDVRLADADDAAQAARRRSAGSWTSSTARSGRPASSAPKRVGRAPVAARAARARPPRAQQRSRPVRRARGRRGGVLAGGASSRAPEVRRRRVELQPQRRWRRCAPTTASAGAGVAARATARAAPGASSGRALERRGVASKCDARPSLAACAISHAQRAPRGAERQS